MSDVSTITGDESNSNSQKCPCCGGTDLLYGRSGVFKVPFVPDTPILQYARSYMPQQFACLSCGFIGFALKQSDLVRLRKEKIPQPS